MSEEDIAARHFVSPAIVKQRLRLASVSPKLHDVYADDGMTLEQLMAFSVTSDQARQEQVWDNISRSGNDEPYQIRRMLTENTVRASDRRAQFIGLDAYEQAGGVNVVKSGVTTSQKNRWKCSMNWSKFFTKAPPTKASSTSRASAICATSTPEPG